MQISLFFIMYTGSMIIQNLGIHFATKKFCSMAYEQTHMEYFLRKHQNTLCQQKEYASSKPNLCRKQTREAGQCLSNRIDGWHWQTTFVILCMTSPIKYQQCPLSAQYANVRPFHQQITRPQRDSWHPELARNGSLYRLGPKIVAILSQIPPNAVAFIKNRPARARLSGNE